VPEEDLCVGVEVQLEALLGGDAGEGFHVAAAAAEEVSVQAEVPSPEDEVDSPEVAEGVDIAGEGEEEVIENPWKRRVAPRFMQAFVAVYLILLCNISAKIRCIHT
jgi:hypothetical protein